MAPANMLDLFTKKINHDEIKLGAIFDLLFSQCDRHQQNVFVTEAGKVWLIDNDQVRWLCWQLAGLRASCYEPAKGGRTRMKEWGLQAQAHRLACVAVCGGSGSSKHLPEWRSGVGPRRAPPPCT